MFKIMKGRILLLLAISSFAIGGSAKQLNPNEALSRISSASALTRAGGITVSDTKPVYTATENQDNQFYVFNIDGDGFAIVSADDRITPLLGYSLSGKFDVKDMPSNLASWLKSYQRQIDWAITNNVSYNSSATTRAEIHPAISPLVTAKWDQDSPYNDMCPKANNKETYSGCVATAMAQVMYYYKYPTKGTGSNSYSWNNTTLSQDFSTVTFDWANMTPTYSSSSTEAANKAVATLMYCCGIGVNMEYGNDASGAYSFNIPRALVNYFGYDKGTTYYMRDYYSKTTWDNMVYNELAAGRPVIYDGINSEDGHEFVCDGYNNGYYHINWGWSGMSDGYFLLSLLDPENQGIGGSSAGYNFLQGAVMGIQPAKSGSSYVPMVITDGDVSANEGTLSRATKKLTMSVDGYIYNCSPFTVKATLGIKLVNSSTNEVKYYESTTSTEMSIDETGHGTAYKKVEMSCNGLPTSGTYICTLAYKNADTGAWNDILVPLGYNSSCKIVASNTSITVSNINYDSQLTISDVQFKSDLYVNAKYYVTGVASVTGLEYFDTVKAALLQSGTSTIVAKSDEEILINLLPGETQSVEYLSTIAKTVKAGTYDFAFVNSSDETVSTPVTVTVGDSIPGTPTLSVSSFTAVNNTGIDDSFYKVPQNNIKLNISLSCTSGYYADQLTIRIYKMVNNSTSGSASYNSSFDTPLLFIKSGDSKELSFSYDFSSGEVGYRYLLLVYNGSKQLSDKLPIILTDPIAGIEDVTTGTFAVSPNPANDVVTVTAGQPIKKIEIYSMQGYCALSVNVDSQETTTVNVSNLTPGHYILTAVTESGIETSHIIKK